MQTMFRQAKPTPYKDPSKKLKLPPNTKL